MLLFLTEPNRVPSQDESYMNVTSRLIQDVLIFTSPANCDVDQVFVFHVDRMDDTTICTTILSHDHYAVIQEPR